MPFPARRLASRFSCPVPVLLSSEKHGFRTITTSQTRTYSPLPLLLVGPSRALFSPQSSSSPDSICSSNCLQLSYCLLPTAYCLRAPCMHLSLPHSWVLVFAHHPFPPPPHHLAYPQCITHLSRVLVFSASPHPLYPYCSVLLLALEPSVPVFAGIMKRIIKGRVLICACVCAEEQ